jgi:hypothetical protein
MQLMFSAKTNGAIDFSSAYLPVSQLDMLSASWHVYSNLTFHLDDWPTNQLIGLAVTGDWLVCQKFSKWSVTIS